MDLGNRVGFEMTAAKTAADHLIAEYATLNADHADAPDAAAILEAFWSAEAVQQIRQHHHLFPSGACGPQRSVFDLMTPRNSIHPSEDLAPKPLSVSMFWPLLIREITHRGQPDNWVWDPWFSPEPDTPIIDGIWIDPGFDMRTPAQRQRDNAARGRFRLY